MPIIIGLVIVGGFLILLTGKKEEEPLSPPELNDTEQNSPSGEQVNVEEIRRLRRELRHQLAKRKKNSQI